MRPCPRRPIHCTSNCTTGSPSLRECLPSHSHHRYTATARAACRLSTCDSRRCWYALHHRHISTLALLDSPPPSQSQSIHITAQHRNPRPTNQYSNDSGTRRQHTHPQHLEFFAFDEDSGSDTTHPARKNSNHSFCWLLLPLTEWSFVPRHAPPAPARPKFPSTPLTVNSYTPAPWHHIWALPCQQKPVVHLLLSPLLPDQDPRSTP